MSLPSPLTTAVSGSFRRHLPEVQEAVKALTIAGVEVLSPRSTARVGETDGFVVLAGDDGTPKDIQERHLAAIAKADFLWLVCPEGHVGASALLEVGYARALGIPVFAFEPPTERVVDEQVEVVTDLVALVTHLTAERGQAPPDVRGLTRLQQWTAAMVEARGFAGETLEELLLLVIEETGELVKAARQSPGYEEDEEGRFARVLDGMEQLSARARQERKQGVAVAATPASADDLPTELADLEIYLAVIANKIGVELAEAIRQKAAADRARRWS